MASDMHLGHPDDKRGETPRVTDLREDLHDFARRPADWEHPYLTVTLDYRLEGNQPNRRPATPWLDEQEKRLREEYGPRGPLYDAAVDGLKELRDALDVMDGPIPQGVAAVIQPGMNNAFILPLAVAPCNSVTVSAMPALFEIAAVQDAAEPFAVLLADTKQAFLHVFAIGTRERDVEMHEGRKGRKINPGAKSMNVSERTALKAAEQEMDNFATGIAEATRTVADEMGVRRLIIASDDQFTATLMEHFPKELHTYVIGTMKADIRDNPTQLLRLALPLVHDAERAQENDICEQLVTGTQEPHGLAVWGIADTLAALETGQVQTLVLATDFSAAGWADQAMSMTSAGHVPMEHPAGGNVADIRPVDLREEFVRMALLSAVGMEFVPLRDDSPVTESVDDAAAHDTGERGGAVAALAAHEGVGALLRFRLDVDQAVFTM